MAWASPQYSKTKFDDAARTFMRPDADLAERELARSMINNWRSSHSFPLNTMQVNLRNRVAKVEDAALIAQRLKRLPSIRKKLTDKPNMRLTQMQDIGGCRAVLRDVRAVHDVVELFARSRGAHVLRGYDDYIAAPQVSGYRSYHLVYRYAGGSRTTWDGLMIEVQLRTRLQHAWATAVETVGFFTQQALKASRGESDWLRFFALMGSAIAQREGTSPVPGTPTEHAVLKWEIESLATSLDVDSRLSLFAESLELLTEDARSGHRYVVLELDLQPDVSLLTTRGFRDLRAATDHFSAIERLAEERSTLDVVMVSVGDMANLRRAYPNYYLDTATFREVLKDVLAD